MDVRLLFFSSSFSARRANDTTCSPSSRSISRTPCVLRPMTADIFDAQTYDLARVGDQHELIIFGDLLRAHDTAGLIGGLHRDDTLAAAGLQSILIGLGALSVAVSATVRTSQPRLSISILTTKSPSSSRIPTTP